MTTAIASLPSEFTLDIERDIRIETPITVAFDALVRQLGADGQAPDGSSMSLAFEAWPGGRWFRDLGDAGGHLWGHVQVIKPPSLIEITGPMFMSYPVVSHIQYRLTETAGATQLTLRHRAMGMIEADHRAGVGEGWNHMLQQIHDIALSS
ncbi:MAG: SRPBCC domain-containing protein [Planctomycetota bacterium]